MTRSVVCDQGDRAVALPPALDGWRRGVNGNGSSGNAKEHPDGQEIPAIRASAGAREKLRALIEGRSQAEDGHSALVRLVARLIVEEALEGEATGRAGDLP